jgi:hypothetical protein
MAATPLLGLSLPADGTTNWGTLVNTSITALLDSAVAGTTTLSSDADVTLTTTTEATNQARQAILLCTGSRAALRTITAPAQSKTYVIINTTTGGFGVKIVGVGPTTGVTVPNGKVFMVAWNGSDFVTTGITTVNLATDVTGVLAIGNGGTGQSTQQAAINALVGTQTANRVLRSDGTNSTLSQVALTTDVSGTLPTANGGTGLSSFTANRIFYASSSSVIGQSANLTFDGAKLGVSGVEVGLGAGAVSSNTAVGGGGLSSNTTGNNNTALGKDALFSNTTSSQSTAVGFNAMYNMRAGNNVAVGISAMYGSATPASNTGAGSVAIGASSLRSVSSGANNAAVGSQSLYNLTTGSSNVAVGTGSLSNLVSGSQNTAVGTYAALDNAGTGSVAVGYLSGGYDYMSSGENVTVGAYSLCSDLFLSGNSARNVAIGYRAAGNQSFAKTVTDSVFVGNYAAYNITNGTHNTFVGHSSGETITTGAKNTILGRYNGNQGFLDIRTASNYIVLSDGDGNPRAYWNAANATFNGGLTLTAYLRTAVASVASAATITPTSDASNQYNVTALAVPATFAAPSGSPVDGQKLLLRIKDNGTARALTWNAIYRAIGTALPTTTVATKTTYVGCIYNSADAAWDVVAVTTQA